MGEGYRSRRFVLGGMAAAPLLGRAAFAQESVAQDAMALPLRATLLEHVGTVVPDVTAAATFHSALFNPAIRTEMQPDPLRYYVDLNGGYLAFGSRANEPRAFIDHFCALVADYSAEGMAAALRGQGIDVAATWATFGLFQDPDGLGVQLVADPGGWFPTVIDAEPLVEGPALLTPMGLGHVSLQVTDFAQSRDFYRRYFGMEGGSNDSGQIWFAMGATNLVLTPAEEAAIDHIGVKVAAFDMDATGAALEAMGAQRVEAVDGQFGPILRFADPAGLVLELEPQQA
jgi:catechol 2,3-dioxygenase-like lactoylglutathione lyase family enzyme